MKNLVIFGNTLLAKVVHFYFRRDSGYQTVAFTVDQRFNQERAFLGLEVIDFETLEKTHPPSSHELFIAVGAKEMNALRERKCREAKAKGYTLARYLSPHAICDSPTGENTFVADMTIIHPFVEIGANNFFWEQVFVGNDSVIENNCYLSPKSAVGTFARIGNNSVLGTSSTVKTRVQVAEASLIGAMCYISRDTERNGVYGMRNAEFLGAVSQKVDLG
jgi:hypothetical protein